MCRTTRKRYWSKKIMFPVNYKVPRDRNYKNLRCQKCGNIGRLIEKFDAIACDICDVWLEDICEETKMNSGGCGFCDGRPNKPSKVERGNSND